MALNTVAGRRTRARDPKSVKKSKQLRSIWSMAGLLCHSLKAHGRARGKRFHCARSGLRMYFILFCIGIMRCALTAKNVPSRSATAWYIIIILDAKGTHARVLVYSAAKTMPNYDRLIRFFFLDCVRVGDSRILP